MKDVYTRSYFADKTADKLRELVDKLNTRAADNTQLALDYYDGKQIEALENFMNQYRKSWKKEQMVPRTRNIVRPIVEHSGQVVKDTPPIFAVFGASEDDMPDEEQSEVFIEMINKAGQYEPWITLDEITRLLKTTLVLTQWDSESEMFVFDILHRGNAYVKHHPVTKEVHLLLYRIESDGEFQQYRLYVSDMVLDFEFNTHHKSVEILSDEDNNLGFIPVSVFHDTHSPRTGFWNNTPMDLVKFNEMNNLHLTESEYVISWMKRPTLFTNAALADTVDNDLSTYESVEDVQSVQLPYEKLPTRTFSGGGVKFGPSTAIQLDTSGVDSPFAEFKAPVVDLQPINDSFASWEKSFASDWSVRIDTAGEGRASSGFQLVVEELPNMELRKLRQKQLASGFNRLFEVVKRISISVGIFNFTEDAKLYTDFTDASLPVETKTREEVWSLKIAENRASLVDYFMEVDGLSKEEALQKIIEVFEVKQIVKLQEERISEDEDEDDMEDSDETTEDSDSDEEDDINEQD